MSTCTIESLKKITHFKKASSDRNSHKLLVSFFHIWFSTSSEENVEEIWFIIMIIIISYSYLITTTTYYLSKHPTCKKIIWFIIPLLYREKWFFFWFLTYFVPILDPRYLRFTVQIPVFRDNFQIKKAKKYKCVRSWFCKINATSTATKNLSLKKKESNPKL